MPLNVMDAHYDSFEKLVLPRLVKENIGVIGMKSLGAGVILNSRAVTAVECLRYAMSLPVSVLVTGCDSMIVLQQAYDTVKNFRPLTASERNQLLAKTATLARGGHFELYKTSQQFDGTTAHPEWLG